MRRLLITAFVLLALVVFALVGAYFYMRAQKTEPAPPPMPVPAIAVEAPAPAAEPAAPAPVEETAPPPAESPTSSMPVKVYGTVMDEETSEPVVARLRAVFKGETPPEFDMEAVMADADDTGAYSMEFDASVLQSVSCSAPGYVTMNKDLALDAPVAGAPVSVQDFRLDFVLESGSSIAGKIIDKATGRGVAGAGIRANAAGGSFMDSMQSAGDETTSQSDGAYIIEGLKPGAYDVFPVCRAQGYILLEQLAPIALAKGEARDGVDFRVELGAVLKGKVTGADGQPIEGAMLNITPANVVGMAMSDMGAMMRMQSDPMMGRSNADGVYEILGLNFDTEYRVGASADGFAGHQSNAFSIARNASPMTMDIRLSKGSRVSGVAVDKQGAVVSDMDLMMMPSMDQIMQGNIGAGFNGSEKTDEQGRFEFKTTPAGKYTIRISPMSGLAFNPLASVDPSADVEVDGVKDITGLRVVLDAAPSDATGVIDGNVLDAQGKPMPDVSVSAVQIGGMPMFPTPPAKTDANGKFIFSTLNTEVKYTISVSSDKGTASQDNVSTGAHVTLRLTSAASIEGVVQDSTGVPVNGCAVSLKREGDDANSLMAMMGQGDGGQTTQTDAMGAFRISPVAPGAYTVTAKSNTLGQGVAGPITVMAAKASKDIVIELKAGTYVRGRAHAGDNSPIAGATIKLVALTGNQMTDMMSSYMPAAMVQGAASGVSGKDGSFEIANVQPGSYNVVASHPDCSTTKVETDVPDGGVSNLDILMGQGGEVVGSCTKDGHPRTGVMITLSGSGGTFQATADQHGQFKITKVPAGTYIAMMIDMGSMAGMAQGGMNMPGQRVVDVADGQTVEVIFGDEGGVTVEGVISNIETGAITTVILSRAGGVDQENIDPMDIEGQIEAMRGMAGQAMIGADGKFKLEGVAPGDYTLIVRSIVIDMSNLDVEALANQNQTPKIRQEITVEDKPITLELALP